MSRYYIEHGEHEPASTRGLIAAVWAPFALWIAHLGLSYALVALDCSWGLFPFTVAGMAGLRVVLIGVTLGAAAGVVVAGVGGVRLWRRLQPRGEGGEPDPVGRHRFLAISALASSAIFLLGVLWTLFPILTTAPCPSY